MAGKSTHCSIFRQPGQWRGRRPAGLLRSAAGIAAVTVLAASPGVGIGTAAGDPGAGEAAARPPAASGSAAIERVAWLAGTWRATSLVPARDAGGAAVTRIVEEHWRAPLAGSMMGLSRTVRGDSLVEYEFLLLRESDGRLAYEARPSGQQPAVFHSVEAGDSSVVFENPDHDFPRRIGYTRVGADSLIAWIEGELEGRVRRVDFPYRRHHDASPR